MQMAQADMKGSKDTRKVVSDSDSTAKEKGARDSGAPKLTPRNASRNTSPKAAVDIQPKRAPDKKVTSDLQSRVPSQIGKDSTPSPTNGRASRTTVRNGSKGTTSSLGQVRSTTRSHASPDEHVVRKTQGAHVHVKSPRRTGCERESVQATANKVRTSGAVDSPREAEVQNGGEHDSPRKNDVHNSVEHVSPPQKEGHDNGARGSPPQNFHDNGEHVSPRETQNTRPRSSNTLNSERPRSSAPCDNGGRKCLHDPSQDNPNDHAFMDGFETREQPWKPGKKVVDHASDQPRSEYRWKSSRKSIPGADRMQTHTPEWRADDPPVSRKGTGGRDGGAAQMQREYDPYGNPLNVPEWEWHPGKGRGNGPVPGEWLPPFRAYSTRAESEPPPFQKGKASGRRHSDEWLPPFRVVDRPASWHRSKGTGSGPPPDQWSPPWGHESATDADRGDSATSARSSRSISCCPESRVPRIKQVFGERDTRSLLNGVVAQARGALF